MYVSYSCTSWRRELELEEWPKESWRRTGGQVLGYPAGYEYFKENSGSFSTKESSGALDKAFPYMLSSTSISSCWRSLFDDMVGTYIYIHRESESCGTLWQLIVVRDRDGTAKERRLKFEVWRPIT